MRLLLATILLASCSAAEHPTCDPGEPVCPSETFSDCETGLIQVSCCAEGNEPVHVCAMPDGTIVTYPDGGVYGVAK